MPLPADLSQDPPIIMIVDDEVDILDMLETLMKSGEEDVRIAKAQSGVDALLMIGEKKPDLLIIDIMMPGMNGYEVCHKLKSSQNTQTIKIVAITGDHSPSVKERALSSGADLFFTKPLEIVEFREKCFQLLQS